MGRTIEIYYQNGDTKSVHYAGNESTERMQGLIAETKRANRNAIMCDCRLSPYCWRWWEDGQETRQQIQSIAECPECGKDVDCIAETEARTEAGEHIAYGTPQGVCCGHLIVDGFDGAEVFKLPG